MLGNVALHRADNSTSAQLSWR